MKAIVRDKQFVKNYQKRILVNQKLDAQFRERLGLFLSGVRNEPLYDHQLTGNKKGLRAFSITGNVRVIYRETETEFHFLDIGTHNQVY